VSPGVFDSSYSYHDAHNYECSCPWGVLAVRIPTMTLTITSVRVPRGFDSSYTYHDAHNYECSCPQGVLTVRIPTMTLTFTSVRVPGVF